eukprot:TRINITY_DN30973_c1_g1_i1.p1 TRINITY_DN30973_c1_g1~~TRINITY_DN30973_c1_g1_i1.p1  ORF type:complete len:535 (+),score=85.89 TRINITY_DN30973_c1_g1_i1:26-1630(+)
MSGSRVPPLLKCFGIRSPHAKALQGIYEFVGVHDGRPCYRQTGVSSGNFLWYSEDALEGPMWVITPKEARIGEQPMGIIAMCVHDSRWPWESTGHWSTCGKNDDFADAPHMSFGIVMPAADLSVQAPAIPGGAPMHCIFRRAGYINERPAFRRVGDDDNPELASLRLFFMPVMGRWLLALVKPGNGGVQKIVARSLYEDGSTWLSLFPWECEVNGWETPSADTRGLDDGAATWATDPNVSVQLNSPAINIRTIDNWNAPPEVLCGIYEHRGMVNGRCYWVSRIEDVSLGNSAGQKALWFAEDRGQWVITGPELIGDSRAVLARIASRAWWPWEAHLSSTTSQNMIGATPWASIPPWHGSANLLSGAKVNWEVANEQAGYREGGFRDARSMVVEMITPEKITVLASAAALHPFVGTYDRSGLLTSRPFYTQTLEAAEAAMGPEACRYVLWYSEDSESWVFTEEFRFLDDLIVEARCNDSAWAPFQVAMPWEVSNGQEGFVVDAEVAVQEVIPEEVPPPPPPEPPKEVTKTKNSKR